MNGTKAGRTSNSNASMRSSFSTSLVSVQASCPYKKHRGRCSRVARNWAGYGCSTGRWLLREEAEFHGLHVREHAQLNVNGCIPAPSSGVRNSYVFEGVALDLACSSRRVPERSRGVTSGCVARRSDHIRCSARKRICSCRISSWFSS